MDARKRLATILAQVRCDIDASVRKLHHLANEAEGLGLNATAAIADDAAEVAEEFAAAFSAAYKPGEVFVTPPRESEVLHANMVASGIIKPTTPPAKQSFSIAALLGLR